MVKQYRYIILAVLLGVTLLFSAALPFYLSQNPNKTPAAGDAIPRATSPLLQAPVVRVDEVVDTAQKQPDSELPNTNCTYPMEYWQSQPETWPPQIILGGKTYGKEDIRTLMLTIDPPVQTYLVQQMYTSLLNVLYGANVTAIESVLIEADRWLQDNPEESGLSEFSRRQGLNLARLFELYNMGEIGPGSCEGASSALAMGSTSTNAGMLPLTGQNTGLPSPIPTQVFVIPPMPTATAVVAQEPPSPPPPPPPTSPPPQPTVTNTPLPLPTATPLPPSSLHPQVKTLAEKYGVSYDEIQAWRDQGFGFGDIEKAYDLSIETGTAVSEIFAMLNSGMSWGEIKDKLSNP